MQRRVERGPAGGPQEMGHGRSRWSLSRTRKQQRTPQAVADLERRGTMSEAAEPKSPALHVERGPAQLAERPGFVVGQFPDEVRVMEFHVDAERAGTLPKGKPVVVNPSWWKQLQEVPIRLFIDFVEFSGFMPRRVVVREHVRLDIDQTAQECPKARLTA